MGWFVILKLWFDGEIGEKPFLYLGEAQQKRL